MSTLTVHVPCPVAEPRGARPAALGFAALLRWAQDQVNARHARQQQSSRTVEAARVRRMVNAMFDMDPRFAADLMAAADRHERD